MPTKEDRAYYNNVITSRFTPIYEYLLPIFGIIMLLVAIVNYSYGERDLFIFFRLAASLTFFTFYFLRNKIPTSIRVISGSSIFMIISLLRIYSDGLSSISLMILMIVILASIVFLRKIFRYICSGIIFIFLIIIPFLTGDNYNISEYTTSVLGFFLVVIMLLLAFNHIANIHIEIIKKLEHQLEITKEKSKKINQLAFYDSLTGLPNEELFKRQLEKLLPNDSSYIVLIDIRDIEIIFSLQGTAWGEYVFKKIGEEFSSLENFNTLIAHTYSNEYVLYFQSMSEAQVISAIDNALNTFNEKHFNSSGLKKLRLYIAIVPLTLSDKNYHDIQIKAMLTLRACKNDPNQKYLIYNASMTDNATKLEELQRLVENKLEDNSFEIYYQKKVDSHSEKILGVEALARLKNTDNSYISPTIFIPVVEKSNLVIPFGEMIIKKVFADLPILKQKYSETLTVSINISPTHLLSENFIDFLNTTSKEFQVNAKYITLEITEEVFIADLKEVQSIITKIKKLGFKISLDDFGSGYSSLQYIAELPLDELKIDRSFTIQIISSQKIRQLLKVIFEMADILDYNIVIEGVETEDELSSIKKIGNCSIQGFYFSRPEKL